MRGRIRSISGHLRHPLDRGWELASSAAGAVHDPSASAALAWQPAEHLGTVAATLRARKEWSLESAARRFDAEDWWYRLTFAAPSSSAEARFVLGFDGLATISDVWLNGQVLFHSENMFVAHEIALPNLLRSGNELVIRCSALDKALEARRPRPRWRTPMIENQQMRWMRATLLGRTPGWSPPAPPVGPWRPVWLESRSDFDVSDLRLAVRAEGSRGIVEADCVIRAFDDSRVSSVVLTVSRQGSEWSTRLERQQDPASYTGRLEISDVQRWWPHTHGEPALYDVRLSIWRAQSDATPVEVDAGRIGFRSVTLSPDTRDFGVSINDVPIFCRGACWTPLDPVSPFDDGPATEAALAQAREAGMNMIRVGGTMCYESDRFFDACDSQGMLLWQDFMFANMDYPADDPAFRESVETEARQLLHRLSGRPCVTVLCGNSEGEQQAAMWGAPRERWEQPLFTTTLAHLSASLAPGVPYWPSSTHGGAFPHQADTGTTSYYGVGAYRLPTTDARRSGVRFATECLAFANIPEEDGIAAMPGGLAIKVHHAAWKARSPRDLGAGWDFDDIRDEYLASLFDLDPLDLRYYDHDKYLDLSRVASGEAMAAAFREWRRARSTCRGALVWFLRDLWQGAGWGLVDAAGSPKAPYYFLKRLLQPRALVLTDEGVNGVFAHVINESSTELDATLEAILLRHGETPVSAARQALTVGPRQTLERPLAALFDGFLDINHAYRFGPPLCDAVVANLRGPDDVLIAQDLFFPGGLRLHVEPDVGLAAVAHRLEPGVAQLTVTTRRLARYVSVRGTGLKCDDQYFNVAPGIPRITRIRVHGDGNIKGQVRALNSAATCRIEVRE